MMSIDGTLYAGRSRPRCTADGRHYARGSQPGEFFLLLHHRDRLQALRIGVGERRYGRYQLQMARQKRTTENKVMHQEGAAHFARPEMRGSVYRNSTLLAVCLPYHREGRQTLRVEFDF
jgi:hypothetical protein